MKIRKRIKYLLFIRFNFKLLDYIVYYIGWSSNDIIMKFKLHLPKFCKLDMISEPTTIVWYTHCENNEHILM